MGLKRCVKPKFLEQIGRGLLGRLLDKFQPEFASNGVALPEASLEDKDYCAALAKQAVSQRGLPENFIEALYSVEAMANAEAKARLMRAVQNQPGLHLERIQEATHADFAVQVFLADPALFAQKHDEARILALSTFEYHGCREPMDRRATFHAPDAQMPCICPRSSGLSARWK